MVNSCPKVTKTRGQILFSFQQCLSQGVDSYDVNADYRAHSSALKSTAAKSESYLTREQLLELRQVERERVELIKRKQLGLQISGTLGVRMDGEAVDE